MYKKRIVVNDIAASTGGTLVILKEFYKYISKYGGEYEWIFLLGKRYVEEKENIKVIVLEEVKNSWLKRLKFDLYKGKKYINKLKPDVVISLQNTIVFGLNIKQIVYIHQLIPFQKTKRFSFLKKDERLLFIHQYCIGFIIKRSIKKADLVIVQTNCMKKAVLKETGVESKKIIIVTPDLQLDNINNERIDLKNNYFFYPASNAIYKNYECIFNACEILNKKSITNFKITLTIKEFGKRRLPNIKFVDKVSREQVIKKYAESILLFPSYMESLGLPLLEARKMGTIIFASDCDFSHEILDGYENAYFFDPFKPSELAGLIENKINGEIELYRNVNKEIHSENNDWKVIFEII